MDHGSTEIGLFRSKCVTFFLSNCSSNYDLYMLFRILDIEFSLKIHTESYYQILGKDYQILGKDYNFLPGKG